MRRLILSGALLLCAATNCISAKAAWVEVAGSAKGEKSTVTNGPGGYTGPAEDWKVTNSAVPTNNTGNNEVSVKGWVLNGPGDDYPVWDSQLYTGASRIASFKWNNVGVRPNSSTLNHTADFSGKLYVTMPAGATPGAPTEARAGVKYEVFPADWNTQTDPEKGIYWITVTPGNGGTVIYWQYVNGAWTAGPGTRNIRQAVQGNGVVSTPTSQTTQSVEVRVKGYTRATGSGLPNGTLYSEANGSIRSIGISMQP